VIARLAAFVALAHAGSGAADGPLAPAAVKPLEKAATDVGKAGRGEELDELLDLLAQAGMEPAARAKLSAAARKELAKAKKPAASVPAAAKTLAKAAADLAAELPDRAEAERAALARLILRLDDSNEAAQQALGRAKVGSEWLNEKARARRERFAAITAAVAKAHQLPIEVKVEPSTHFLFEGSKCKAPLCARACGLTLHGVWSAEKLDRVLRESLRALALDRFLVEGELSLPRLHQRSFVTFDEEGEYLKAVAVAAKRKLVDAQTLAEATKLGGIFVGDTYLGTDATEASLSALLHSYLVTDAAFGQPTPIALDDAQAAAWAGLANWTSLAYLGARLPSYVVEETKESLLSSGGTASLTDEQRRVRERLLLLSDAGIAGGRAWMQYLADHRQDPPFSAALVDQVGRLGGEELLKATFVFEWIALDGPTLPWMRKMPDRWPAKTRLQILEDAAGRPLAEFEAAWRDWIVPERRGLAGRLAGPQADTKPSPLEQETLDLLLAIRKQAACSESPLEIDHDLATGCRTHALYLARNPDQAARWPDAHEEYPDRPGFDPQGAFAGTHAVIAPGVANGREAVAGWMATYYHRLPLLDPGLMRVGIALESGTAVLDCGSFVKPRTGVGTDAQTRSEGDPTYWGIAWPPAGATDMPTRFQAELPQPVPGEDESTMGYPITWQLRYRFEARPTVELALHSGSATGPRVACHFSTPTEPTNPKLATDDAWCLIPKKPLDPGGAYTVTAKIEFHGDAPSQDSFSWSFRCGR
jgi:hypothetical protein